MSTTPILPASSAAAPPAANGLPSGQSLNNMFLQLLVAQLQNQDPTSPVDPSQFIGQLAQFSELSEVTSIYQLLQQVVPATGGSGSSGGASPGGGTAAPGAVVAPTAATTNNFATPSLLALASKIKGVF